MKAENKRVRKIAAAVGILFFLSGCPTEYNRIMIDKLKIMVGQDFNEYRFFSYPTNNFGAGTAYSSSADLDRGISICDPAYCLGLTAMTSPGNASNFQDWLRLGEFVGIGDAGPPLTLSEQEQSKLNVELNAPKIGQIVDLGAGIDYSKGVKTNVTLGRAYPRRLRRQKFLDYVNALPGTNLIKKAFDRGTLVVIVNDLVMEGLNVSICVDKSLNSTLDAKLKESVGKVVGGGGSMKLQIQTTSSGCYSLQSVQPVIVAALAREQPAAGELAAPTDDFDWKGWQKRQPADLGK